MEPITTAIVAAIGAGLAKVSESAIVDAYTGVKNTIVKKFGKESALKKAVDDVEANPTSIARKGVLDEEVVAVNANEDADILQATKLLLVALEKLERQQSGATGVKLEDIEVAKSLTIRNITSTGTGVDVKHAIIEENFEINGVNAGVNNSPK